MQRFRDKPFVLIGVNSDEEREVGRAAAAQHGHIWRSFWDGSEGPIASHYRVSFWPTIYVIDGRGFIRAVQIHDNKLDQTIETLLRELQEQHRF